MTLLSKITPYKHADITNFVPVTIAGTQIGWTPRAIAILLSEHQDTWIFASDIMALNDRFDTFESRTTVIDSVFLSLAHKGLLPVMPDYSMMGDIDWYDVRATLESPALCMVKRFYSTYLGIKIESIMLHGYQGDHYTLSKRSMHVHSSPGKFDLMSVGSVTHSHTIQETLHHEAFDEAGFPVESLRNVKQSYGLDFCYLTSKGLLKHEHFHVFDLELTDTIQPQIQSPIEVQGFYPTHVDDLLVSLHDAKDFKPQTVPAMIDFLIRHGHITADHPEYQALKDTLAKSCDPALCCPA